MATRFPAAGLSAAERIEIAADAFALIDPKGTPWSLTLKPRDGGACMVYLSTSPASLINLAAPVPTDPADVTGGIWESLGPFTAVELIAFPAPLTAVVVTTTGGRAVADLCWMPGR